MMHMIKVQSRIPSSSTSPKPATVFPYPKLRSTGIAHPVLSWINSFLSDRSFKVVIGSYVSATSPILFNASQSSFIGPLLFLIYINDICASLPGNALIYANDLKFRSTDTELMQASIDAVIR